MAKIAPDETKVKPRGSGALGEVDRGLPLGGCQEVYKTVDGGEWRPVNALKTALGPGRSVIPGSALQLRTSALEERVQLLVEEVGRFLHGVVGAWEDLELSDVGAVVGPRLPGVELAVGVALLGPEDQ